MGPYRVFVIGDQSYSPDNWGMSGYAYKHVEGPLRASSLIRDISVYYRSEGISESSLLNRIEAFGPDLVCISQEMHLPLFSSNFMSAINVPVVAFYFDGHNKRVCRMADVYSPFVVSNVLFGAGPTYHYMTTSNYIFGGVPMVLPLIDEPEAVDIDVSFLGSLFPARRHYIELLKEAGINVFIRGGLQTWREYASQHNMPYLDGAWETYNSYLEYMSRSKITLNFSFYSPGIYSMRGRVGEAFYCRTLLFEEENSVTAMFYKPWVDYIPFTESTLVPLIAEYLPDKVKRDWVRLHGHESFRDYTVDDFVRLLFERAATGSFETGEVWNKEFHTKHLGEDR